MNQEQNELNPVAEPRGIGASGEPRSVGSADNIPDSAIPRGLCPSGFSELRYNPKPTPHQNSAQLHNLSAIYLWPTMILLASVIISLAWVYTARLKTNQTANLAPATTAATLPVQSRPSTGCNL